MGREMNTKSIRAGRKQAFPLQSHRPWWAAPVAFAATLLALPVSAVTIPAEPLATGIRVAPNILFILDDSGSMAWENINNGSINNITGSGGFSDGPSQNGVTTGNSGDLTDDSGASVMYEQNYVTNTLYYNPNTTYQPWVTASGNRVSGGTNYTSAFSNTNYVTYTDPLTGASTSGGSVDLSGNTRTFYMPKDVSQTGTTYLSNVENYYRFHIPAGGADVVRSTWGDVVESSNPAPGFPKTGLSASAGNWLKYTVNVSSSIETMTVQMSGGSGDGDLYVRYNAEPTTSRYDCRPYANGNNETCTISPTSAGTYYVYVNAYSNMANVTLAVTLTTTNRCGVSAGTSSKDWVNCTSNRPEIASTSGTGTVQRSVSAEKENFATWYSYYRTRIKAAKGSAAEAFNSQGRKVRVGYRSLHQNGASNFNIPVGDGNDGRFVNGRTADGDAAATTSRSTWFNRLFAQYASDGTPLQSVLDDAGQYFQQTGSSGPYGPESGSAQFSCRQNFTILTTDGYWNGGSVSVGTGGDDNSGSTYDNGLPVGDPNRKTGGYVKSDPYQDGYSGTLADVAMKYWKTDLRTLSNNVPTTETDPAFWQHMVTFTISIGLKTTKGWTNISDVPSSNPGWPKPGNDSPNNIDDLLHAAVNGHGTFVAASSPKDFADGLTSALAAIAQRTASFSNATASDATSLNTGTKIFKASYVSGLWTGALKAEYASTGAEYWSASIPVFSSRQNKVFTYNGTSGAIFPTAAQITALDKSGVGSASYEVSGTDNADYIKGKKTKEGTGPGQLRVRSTLLGDIVNSSPAYVDETDTVYIGANDGMLHAFNASTGSELFAYVPNIVNFGNLKNFSAGDYTHQWFVDGPIAISRRALGPSSTNILVGTLGRGGKGLYALDVTNPGAFGTSNVKWERAETPGNNMGMILGAPILAKVRNGVPTPAVIAGNGPNSTSDKAVLLVMDMATGSVIREIPTDNTTGNGLFAPTGLYAADGSTLVYAYAGDLQGNIWKFDMTSTNPASWSASKVFHAEKTAGTPQPITAGLATAVDPRTNTRWVFFGTGSYLTAADGNDKSAGAQSMYGVMDNGTTYTRTNLTSRSVTTDGSTGQRYFEELATLPSSSKGWYVDLPDEGERIVQNAQIDGSFLVTASQMPSGNSCDDVGGSGYINALTPFAGIASGKSYFDLDGDGNTDDTGTSGKPTGSVKTNGMPTLPVLLPGQIIINTSGGVTQKLNKGQALWNRVSWREIRSD